MRRNHRGRPGPGSGRVREQSSRPLIGRREFIIIGEAAGALARIAPEIFSQITRARRVVDFHNQLTHEYPTVDDALVWAIAERDVPVLRRECAALIQRIGPSDDAG